MNTYTSFATVLALTVAGAPLVSHAQDPAAEYKTVLELRGAKKGQEALARIDKVLAAYGNPASRVGQQFAFFAPFFLWQKGETLTDMGQVDQAYAVFKELSENPKYKDPEMIKKSKVLPGWGEEGYSPLLTASVFQMGLLRYKEAAGSQGKPGNPKKYDECIPLLEEYLKLYEGKGNNKVSKKELEWGLDGKVCFLLMQSYLLKEKPNFQKAGEYLEKGKKAKVTLSGEMFMQGMNTVMQVALQHPDYVDWVSKLVDNNPGSLHLSADRLAPYSGNFFNYAIKFGKIEEEALRAGDMKKAGAAARAVTGLLGLMPDTAETLYAPEGVTKLVGDYPKAIPDKQMGSSYNGSNAKILTNQYTKLMDEQTPLEGYAILAQANTAAQMGSNRLAKAGFKVLLDRYPKLRQKQGDQWKDLLDTNRIQYAQFCRATGDEATATKVEGMVDSGKVDASGRNMVAVNKMQRFVQQKEWDKVVPAADEVMRLLSGEKGTVNYVAANFSKLAALYQMQKMEDVVKVGEDFLNSGMLKPKEDQLTQEQVNSFEGQARYFVMDAYRRLADKDESNLDKSLEASEAFMKKFPSLKEEENPMAPNVYYNAVDTLLKRDGHGDEAAAKQDRQKALQYCDVIAKNWPNSEVYPTARLLAGNIIIHGEDDDKKGAAIDAFEQSADSALKQPNNRGRSVASTALFYLASYSPEFPRAGEDESAVTQRVAGYFDRFWKEADCEGNPLALQMAALQLSRSLQGKDVAAYEKAVAKAQEVIARDATYAFRNNTQNPELERTINSYVSSYVEGEKSMHGKDLSLEEKTQHLTNFPGIQKEDRYTNAILHMALLTSMNEALSVAKRAGDTKKAADLERDIAHSFRAMRDSFKPEDLTNFICVQVGNYEVDYASRFRVGSSERAEELDMALAYFEQVISRNTDYQNEALLGKANALALSSNAAQQQQAFALYTKLAGGNDPAIVAPALVGLTNLNMTTQNYRGAVDSASKFIEIRGSGVSPRARLEMMLKLGEAYCASGDVIKGLQTYMNLYAQNRGNITFSAPAVKAMMEQLWKRNTPSSGDRLKGNFKQSDRWKAWHTGLDYVTQIRRSGIDKKMTPGDRDLFNEVTILVDEYGKDSAVQREEKEKNDFQSKIQK